MSVNATYMTATGTVADFATYGNRTIVWVVLTGGGAAAGTLVIREGGASGTIKLNIGAPIATTVDLHDLDIACVGDIHATLGGSGATCTIGWE